MTYGENGFVREKHLKKNAGGIRGKRCDIWEEWVEWEKTHLGSLGEELGGLGGVGGFALVDGERLRLGWCG